MTRNALRTTPPGPSSAPDGLRRRSLLAMVLAGSLALSVAPFSASDAKAQQLNATTAQKIADHFSSVKTMQGEFVQFGPRGEQTGGKFYIERPGKLRFNYDEPSPMRVISDGKQVVIGNQKLKTWDVYPLSKTPLSLLLANSIDLSTDMVRQVKEDPDLTTIVLGNKTIFGDSLITMMFDTKTYDLRQWTITDAQAKETSVIIMNVKTGVDFDQRIFRMPESLKKTRE